MKRNFGFSKDPDMEPAEVSAGALYAIFAIVIVVIWVAIFSH